MKHGIVGRISEGLFKYQGWPTVCKDDKGNLFVACSGGRLEHICPFGKNFLYTSSDEGETWSAPSIINDTHLDDRDAGLTYLGDGKILMMYFNNPASYYTNRSKSIGEKDPLVLGVYERWSRLPEEQLRGGSYTMISRDGGKTFGERSYIPVTAPHGAIKLRDGRLMLMGRECYTDFLKEGIYVYVSDDEGKNWTRIADIKKPDHLADDTLLCEPHIVELDDGSIVGAIRVQEKGKGTAFTVYTCFSYDKGLTWTEPAYAGICGSPPHLLLHSSGALIITYSRRLAPFGQYARLSYDGGKTWGEELTVGAEVHDIDQGYPSTVELSDGSLITVYYQKYMDDRYNSILYTKWSLPEA